MKSHCMTLGKPEPGYVNEDAVSASQGVIAVSDGAGGGGLFADRWARYLLDKLPTAPIRSAEELDQWIGNIWEPFYNDCEQEAQRKGGMLLDKFYDEGSFATLVAVWQQRGRPCSWMSYGDSAAFHYNYKTRKLACSVGSLVDFEQPPYLINCKDELQFNGFKQGEFDTDEHSVVFVTSDALAHYLLMMYEVAHREQYDEDLQKAIDCHSKNANYIHAALLLPHFDFEADVMNKLLHSARNRTFFNRHLKRLQRDSLLAYDDYSIAMLTDICQ